MARNFMVMNQKLFYKELGCLMYSLAAVDGKVADSEIATLKRIVREELVPLEVGTDKYGTDNAFITEFEFDVLVDQDAEPQGCFDSFIAYISMHKKEVSPKLKQVIMNMAHAVTGAFHGVNKDEVHLLAELHRELEMAQKA